jgi:hypothetical protein
MFYFHRFFLLGARTSVILACLHDFCPVPMLIFILLYQHRHKIKKLGFELRQHNQRRNTELTLTQFSKSKKARSSCELEFGNTLAPAEIRKVQTLALVLWRFAPVLPPNADELPRASAKPIVTSGCDERHHIRHDLAAERARAL